MCIFMYIHGIKSQEKAQFLDTHSRFVYTQTHIVKDTRLTYILGIAWKFTGFSPTKLAAISEPGWWQLQLFLEVLGHHDCNSAVNAVLGDAFQELVVGIP